MSLRSVNPAHRCFGCDCVFQVVIPGMEMAWQPDPTTWFWTAAEPGWAATSPPGRTTTKSIKPRNRSSGKYGSARGRYWVPITTTKRCYPPWQWSCRTVAVFRWRAMSRKPRAGRVCPVLHNGLQLLYFCTATLRLLPLNCKPTGATHIQQPLAVRKARESLRKSS